MIFSMGYDMHCVVEARNKKTEKWECFGVSIANRNSTLFSRIADVNNSEDETTYIEPIDAPRGWPADASDSAYAWRDNSSLPHYDTWLGRAELEDLQKCYQGNLWKELGFGHLTHFFNLEESWHKGAFKHFNDLRVLFFFDR
jgi:hypothetical protein